MKRLYKYFSLVAAKLVGRRHPRDIDPPGMKELKNAFISKSDSAITCRPDFNPVSESVTALSSYAELAQGDNSDDYMNSCFGIYGSDSLSYLSTMGPMTDSSARTTPYCTGYSTGTAKSRTVGSSIVYFQNAELVHYVWPGMWFRFASDDPAKLYRIKQVLSSTSIELTDTVDDDHVSAGYENYVIYNNHNPVFGNYKFNQQQFTTGVIYSTPTVNEPILPTDVSGPFYAQSLEISSSKEYSTGAADFSHDSNDAVGYVDAVGEGFIAHLNIGGVAKMFRTTTPEDHDSWVELPFSPSDTADFTVVSGGHYAGYEFYSSGSQTLIVGGAQTSTGKAAIAVTTDLGSTAWTMHVHSEDTVSNANKIVRCGSWTAATPTSQTFYVATLDGGVISLIDPTFTTWTDIDSGSGETFQDIVASQFTLNGDLTTHYGVITLDSSGRIYYCNDAATMTLANTIDTSGNEVDWYYIRPFYTGPGYPSGEPQRYSFSVYGYSTSGIMPTVAHIYYYSSTGAAVGGLDGDRIGYRSNDRVAWKVARRPYYSSNGWTAYYPCAGSDYSNSGKEFLGEAYALSLASYPDPGGAYAYQVAAACSAAMSSLTGEYVGITYANTEPFITMVVTTSKETKWAIGSYQPLSDDVRSVTHSVLDGYVVLLGVREYDEDEDLWTFYPRRIKWSVPLAPQDFTGTGSGTADVPGTGSFLDSRPVNGRIVTFESSGIGAISPRGYYDDPWEYDRIKDNIRSISNPVVVDDVCYFIDDSGLLRATNGITVDSPPFSFDLTEYDDFNSDIPIWLVYAPELESLAVYNPSSSESVVYLIETGSGGVSRLGIESVNGGQAKSIVAVEGSSDRRLMITFNPITEDTDELVCSELSTGDVVTGIDEWTSESGDDTYHYTDIQTGEIYLVPEGQKTAIKHVIVRTYTDGTDIDTNPILVVQCRSLEDTDWHDNGDRNGTITVNDASCGGNATTAWSNTLGYGGSTVYNTPCLATQARVYVGSSLQTLGTDYTITDTKEITFAAPTGDTVYAYWENEPTVKVGVGDFIQTTEGWHRITQVTFADAMSLDHYLSTGSDNTATHHPGEPIPTGDGEVKIGISKLVEGVRLRFLIFNRSDGDATVTKITGYSIGHIPAGEKIVEV